MSTIDAPPYTRMWKVLVLIGLLENSRGRREVIRVASQILGVCPHCLQPLLHVSHKTARDAGELIAGDITTPRVARAGQPCPQRRHVALHLSTQT
jgi:hypothetical protein